MIITQTPLRISFLGGGTDFPDFYSKYGGCVLTTAIDKYVYCIVKARFDSQIYVNYSVKEIVGRVDELKHELVREAMRQTGITGGVEITFLSDVPATGSGLGSSSSVTVGVLAALYQFTGRAVEAARLAQEACEIEIEILAKPMGVQDQYIAAYGGVKFLEFKTSGQVVVTEVALTQERLADLESYLVVFFTGRTRDATSVLAEQKRNIPDRVVLLRHLAQLAKEGRRQLEKGNIAQLGRLVDESWHLKKQLASSISNPQIDRLYQAAKAAGAVGGKISGAGGGGFLTLFVPPSKRPSVRRALAGLREMPVGLARDGAKVIFNIGR